MKGTFLPLLLLLPTFLGMCALAMAGDRTKSAKDLVQVDRVLVIGHRGSSAAYPENTVPSFQAALDATADFIELDYHHSSDGVPIVIHDGTLDRTTDAIARWGGKEIPVSSKSLAELLSLDAGAWKAKRFQGTKLPTLEEALDLIQSGSTTLIEQKGGDAKTCVELLRRKNLLDQVVVQSFHWDFLADCHRLAPDLVLGALGHDKPTSALFDEAKKSGASIIGWNHKELTPDAVRAANGRGLRVWSYTINDPGRAKALVAMGVVGIITDVPDLMAKVLRKPVE